MKKFPTFIVSAIASFVLTCSAFAAASDDKGVTHWLAQATSAVAALMHG
jgi:hypothetical protein